MNSSLNRLTELLEQGGADDGLVRLYGAAAVDMQKSRYRALLADARRLLHIDRECIIASVPGRTELGGNHTDHNNGRVLASAVDLDCIAVFAGVKEPVVTLFSDDRAEPIVVDLESLAPDPEERGHSHSLVRGMAAARTHASRSVSGFSAVLHSTCRPGTGLSSSAAFSVLIGGMFELAGGNGDIDLVRFARDGRYAENIFFGKPCGLMDQLSCSVGSTLGIDFENPDEPVITNIQFQPEQFGYRLLIIDTGGSHVNLTPEYAAVTEEIGHAMELFDREKARGLSLESILERIPEIRDRAGDRALLRLMHFVLEDRRAADQLEALQSGDFNRFLSLVKQSGDSSCALLQNCSTSLDSSEQGIMLARALSTELFPDAVCRVHGGGFAGTAQAYVPIDQFDEYRTCMERVFGADAVIPVRIGRPGFCTLSGSGWS